MTRVLCKHSYAWSMSFLKWYYWAYSFMSGKKIMLCMWHSRVQQDIFFLLLICEISLPCRLINTFAYLQPGAVSSRPSSCIDSCEAYASVDAEEARRFSDTSVYVYVNPLFRGNDTARFSIFSEPAVFYFRSTLKHDKGIMCYCLLSRNTSNTVWCVLFYLPRWKQKSTWQSSH